MKKRKVIKAAVTYPAGFFCALIDKHDWPPSFVSCYPAGIKRFIPSNNRENGGFDKSPVRLTGAIPYMNAGPVGTM